MKAFDAYFKRARRVIAAPEMTYHSVHEEARQKGFDLPYEDELMHMLSSLTGMGNDEDSQEWIVQASERDVLKRLKHGLNITGPIADYYELLFRLHARTQVRNRIISLKGRAHMLERLLKKHTMGI